MPTKSKNNIDQPTYDNLYAFLRQHYKHSRFEGMAGNWCPDYAELVTNSTMDQISNSGYGFISCHDAYKGQLMKFNGKLEILEDDKPPGERPEYRHGKGHLTHLLD